MRFSLDAYSESNVRSRRCVRRKGGVRRDQHGGKEPLEGVWVHGCEYKVDSDTDAGERGI